MEDSAESGTAPKSKKSATGIFKEKEFSRLSFNPKMHSPPAKRESIVGGDTLDVHDDGRPYFLFDLTHVKLSR